MTTTEADGAIYEGETMGTTEKDRLEEAIARFEDAAVRLERKSPGGADGRYLGALEERNSAYAALLNAARLEGEGEVVAEGWVLPEDLGTLAEDVYADIIVGREKTEEHEIPVALVRRGEGEGDEEDIALCLCGAPAGGPPCPIHDDRPEDGEGLSFEGFENRPPEWDPKRKVRPDSGERESEYDCLVCGGPATCIGRYEGHGPVSTACDTCCGHGNEDGWCVPVERVSRMRRNPDRPPSTEAREVQTIRGKTIDEWLCMIHHDARRAKSAVGAIMRVLEHLGSPDRPDSSTSEGGDCTCSEMPTGKMCRFCLTAVLGSEPGPSEEGALARSDAVQQLSEEIRDMENDATLTETEDVGCEWCDPCPGGGETDCPVCGRSIERAAPTETDGAMEAFHWIWDNICMELDTGEKEREYYGRLEVIEKALRTTRTEDAIVNQTCEHGHGCRCRFDGGLQMSGDCCVHSEVECDASSDETRSTDEVECPECGHRWLGNPGDWFMGHDREMQVWERCPECDEPLVIHGEAQVTHEYTTTRRHQPTDEEGGDA